MLCCLYVGIAVFIVLFCWLVCGFCCFEWVGGLVVVVVWVLCLRFAYGVCVVGCFFGFWLGGWLICFLRFEFCCYYCLHTGDCCLCLV